MTIIQKWLSGLIGLGAGYLVVSNPQGVYRAAQGFQKLTGGTVTQITTGGKKGGA